MQELKERFINELIRSGGIAKDLPASEEALPYVLDLLSERGAKRVLIAESPLLKELDLKKALLERGVEVLDGDDPKRLRELDVGITGVLAAVADSGTLLLGGPSRADWQWASLLPMVHISLVRVDQIRPDLESASLDLKEARVRGDEEFVFITGPSRTADIAITLLLGMHGPTELHVLIVP
jgi:L-lactate dehydrogenase complex protein LldG